VAANWRLGRIKGSVVEPDLAYWDWGVLVGDREEWRRASTWDYTERGTRLCTAASSGRVTADFATRGQPEPVTAACRPSSNLTTPRPPPNA